MRLMSARCEMDGQKGHAQHLPSAFGMKAGAERFPLMVLPQVSNVCNSRCVHCWFNANTDLRKRDGVRYMEPLLLRKIVDEMAQHTQTKPLMRITGTGEPLLMPGLDDELVRAAGEKGVRVAIITNGSLLVADRSRRLIDAGVEAIEISADAADAATYAKIRKGLNFETLLRNIDDALEHRDRRGEGTKILVSFVENPEQIDPDRVEAFWRTRVDNVIRRKFLTYGQLSESGYAKDTYLPTDQRVPCPYPFERMPITANGNVTFCNFDVADGHYMGNVGKQTIEEIWKNLAYEAWRQKILAGAYEELPLCSKCSDWKFKSWNYNFFKVLDEAAEPGLVVSAKK
ncbi:putative Radical SAM domain protein [Rhodospirillaceae bacterium LM-1]|nr:putative Radical SAM domain protein [Rhodospirillaceae bacterium LM-1]